MDDIENAPVITTVIRAYNRAATIDRAIESALAQTLSGQPIVVVDDASSDETPEKVRAYGDRVRLIVHDDNRGPSAAGNTGLAAVETPFVAFLDSDDVWDPLFLEQMLAALRADPTKVFAYCNYRLVYEHAGIELPVDTPAAPAGPGDVLKSIRAVTSATAALTVAVRRVGGFQETLWYNEDQDLQLRCAFRYPKGFVRIPEYLMRNYISGSNSTQNYDYNISSILKFLDKYVKHPGLRNHKFSGTRLKSLYLIQMTGRKFVRAQVNKTPTRSVGLVILNGQDPGSINESLTSAAAQTLPPIEAVVLAPGSAGLDRVLAQDWPFPVSRLDTGAQDGWRALRHALAASHGELLAFLNAGDRWTETALDRHRRAFSSTLKRVAFSYGGFAGETQPAPTLANRPAHRIYQMIAHWVPGSLSAMAVDRRALTRLPNLPLPADCPLWLAIASRLSLEQPGVVVRLREPAVAQGGKQTRDITAIIGLLTTLSETGPGIRLAALAERVDVAAVSADAPSRFPLGGAEDREPI